METRINIAEILKNKSKGTKLYSSIFGEVTYITTCLGNIKVLCPKLYEKYERYFYNDGKFYSAGEPVLFPSKEMHDWNKFSWKKGDVLSCGVDNLCIFEKWANKEYTEFYAKFVTPNYSGNTFKTEKWSKETNGAVIKQYISNIEEFKGGKLNLTTLEIEKTPPEFKDGDIVCMMDRYDNYCFIFIYKNEDNENFYYHAHMTRRGSINLGENEYLSKPRNYSARFATDLEKQQLFSALANKGKAWDSEKKKVVNLKPKFDKLKPFDKVIVRCSEVDRWSIDFFSYKAPNGYICTGDACFGYCLPYNDETAHLLGTTDDWKGGEQ